MKHLAIIADGNRRWGRARGFDDYGAKFMPFALATMENCIEWGIKNGLESIATFVLSTENFGRAQAELDNIFDAARGYFVARQEWYKSHGVRVLFRGRKDRIPTDVIEDMESTEEATKDCDTITFYVLADYGGRNDIASAAASGATTEEALNEVLCGRIPEPDMIIRTGGKHRLSNFLLWQAAYSELYFTDILFPDLDAAKLDEAAKWYGEQARTFGK